MAETGPRVCDRPASGSCGTKGTRSSRATSGGAFRRPLGDGDVRSGGMADFERRAEWTTRSTTVMAVTADMDEQGDANDGSDMTLASLIRLEEWRSSGPLAVVVVLVEAILSSDNRACQLWPLRSIHCMLTKKIEGGEREEY